MTPKEAIELLKYYRGADFPETIDGAEMEQIADCIRKLVQERDEARVDACCEESQRKGWCTPTELAEKYYGREESERLFPKEVESEKK